MRLVAMLRLFAMLRLVAILRLVAMLRLDAMLRLVAMLRLDAMLRLVTVACDWFLLATDSFPLKYFTADLYPSSSFLLPADRLTQRLVVLEPKTG
ncbi:hypothetical protein F511_37649 [Dorcoceras hygrometricum]|uniref:Uncharacterized protein n=1 Tax=Dorcoceras hygrometricum TaxID=472368 RepID=A0A2Z7DBQ9_9LAMI|nr:hypothetical protein F511_37649 [Dorcoceras hygrometricum]